MFGVQVGDSSMFLQGTLVVADASWANGAFPYWEHHEEAAEFDWEEFFANQVTLALRKLKITCYPVPETWISMHLMKHQMDVLFYIQGEKRHTMDIHSMSMDIMSRGLFTEKSYGF